jgi:3-hydroxyanthranilate 3,4-dioxygenase
MSPVHISPSAGAVKSPNVLSSRPMMNPFSATDLKRWVEENRHLYQPPYKTNRILAHYSEFFVLVLNGPNARLDFHREPGEEFFFQIHGDIELHVKPEGERRQVVKIREGEMFLCPGGVAH